MTEFVQRLKKHPVTLAMGVAPLVMTVILIVLAVLSSESVLRW